MFEKVKDFWRRLIKVNTSEGAIKRAFDVYPVASRDMEQNISLWYAMYVNDPPWETCDVYSVGLPGAIAREMSRSALAEAQINITGSDRAEYISEQIDTALNSVFPAALEEGLAMGGVAFKPVPYKGRLILDYTTATHFTPTAFDVSGQATAGVFREVVKSKGEYYVRLEYHGFEDDVYFVRNKAYKSGRYGTPGAEVDLTVVPEWAELPEEIHIQNITRPLFSYFRNPVGNTVDFGSPLGVSVYAGAATSLIREADEQWGRLMWEYDSGERKIFVDSSAAYGNDFKYRLFEYGDFGGTSGEFFKEFTPEFRDSALYNGFNRIVQRIEFETGLSYGDISDPTNVEKTATEIRASKQRKYVTINNIQRALSETIDGIAYAMNVYCDIYSLAPVGEYELNVDWGDSILDDPDAKRLEKSMDLQELASGIMQPYEYRMKWYGEDEDTAKENLPGMEELVDESQVEIE